MKETELKPCECGRIPRIIIGRNPYRASNAFVGRVVCECGEQISNYGLVNENKQPLINAWNRSRQ
jgi:hypothetical protein